MELQNLHVARRCILQCGSVFSWSFACSTLRGSIIIKKRTLFFKCKMKHIDWQPWRENWDSKVKGVLWASPLLERGVRSQTWCHLKCHLDKHSQGNWIPAGLCNSAGRAGGKAQASLGITTSQDCRELWNAYRKALARSHYQMPEMKKAVCHNPQSLIPSPLTWCKKCLNERGVKFETCNTFREVNIQNPLEMTNNGHSGPQGRFSTYQVRHLLSKLAQRARGWARQGKAWQHQTHLYSLLQESEAHFFK